MVIDIVVIAVLLISALISFLRGFIRETLTILGVVGGLAAAYYAGPMLAPLMKGWLGVHEGAEPQQRLLGVLPYPILADILSYGLIFIIVVIILSLISHALAEGARAVGLGPVDRTLGVAFGLARGVLLVALLYLPFHLVLDEKTKNEWFEGSKTFVYLEAMSEELKQLLPDSAIKNLEESAKKAQDGAAVKKDLEGIDVLKQDNAPVATQPSQAPPGAAGPGSPGYNDEFRKKMDNMFKQETLQPTQPPQPDAEPASPVPPATHE